MGQRKRSPLKVRVVAPKEYPEVLLLAPADSKDVTFIRTLDMMVEYGMYVDSDEGDNLPAKLPADLSQYKAIVVDSAVPAAIVVQVLTSQAEPLRDDIDNDRRLGRCDLEVLLACCRKAIRVD